MTSRRRVTELIEANAPVYLENIQRDYVQSIEHAATCEADLCFVPFHHGEGVRGNRRKEKPEPPATTRQPHRRRPPPPTSRPDFLWPWPAGTNLEPLNRERFGMTLFELIVTGELDDYLSPTIQRGLFAHTDEVGRILFAKYLEISERLRQGKDPYTNTERYRKWRKHLTR